MQRVFPCRGLCTGQPALATKSGDPLTAGQIPGPYITYVCARCGRPSTLQSYEFHSLPAILATPANAHQPSE